MIYSYTCYDYDLDNRPFTDEDKQRVDMATGSFTQISSLRALSRLEYFWSMAWGTLNVDTSSNIICLSPEMKALFDQGLWILTPEKRILDIYLQNPRATINEPFYNYTLMTASPIPDPNPMRDISLTFCDAPPTSDHFSYPFDTLRALASHVHPRFVICHLGYLFAKAHIRHFGSYTMRDNIPHRPIIHAVMDVFRSWTRDIPSRSRFFSRPMSNKRLQNDSDSQQSLRTVPHRLHPKQFNRAQKKYQDKLNAKRRKEDARLDKKALHALEADDPPRTTRKDFLQNWILSIAEQASALPDEVESSNPCSSSD
ncbi:hypothetical protein H0H93_004130 [Arthromyces matolae]|nr:hypothetical protein H0H93_004130 [Arthromyces matolae]